jgi:hypothetical protein
MNKSYIKYSLIALSIISFIALLFVWWLFYKQEQKKIEIQEQKMIEQKQNDKENEELSQPKNFEDWVVGYSWIISQIKIRWVNWKLDYKARITSNTWVFLDIYQETANRVPEEEWQFPDINDLSITYNLYDTDGFKVISITRSLFDFSDVLDENNNVVAGDVDGSLELNKEKYKKVVRMSIEHRIPIPRK